MKSLTEKVVEKVNKRLESGETVAAPAALSPAAAETDGRGLGALNMNATPEIIRNSKAYTGRVFAVDERTVMLQRADGTGVTVERQVVRHIPSVVMLVHDCKAGADRYLIEREYRAGSNSYVYGLPAGLRDPGESALDAAFRELAEETGIIADPAAATTTIDALGEFYSSEGMADERVSIFVLHLYAWELGPRHFDADENVQSCWVSWEELLALPMHSSNTVLPIQHEELRRLKEKLAEN